MANYYCSGVNVDTEKVYFYRKDTQKNRYVLDKRINGVLDEYPGYVFIKVRISLTITTQ